MVTHAGVVVMVTHAGVVVMVTHAGVQFRLELATAQLFLVHEPRTMFRLVSAFV